jgi:DNA-binding MarR family transcriptional regulator
VDHPSAVDGDGRELRLTSAGRAALDRLTAARRDGLVELLAGWDPEHHPELAQRLQELAHDLLADDDRMLRAAAPARTTS